MAGTIYRLIPGLKEFEDGVEQVIGAYKSIKGIGDYLDKNSNAIVENMGRMVGKALHDIWDDMKNKITISPSILEPIEKAYGIGKGNGKNQYAAKPGAQGANSAGDKATAIPKPEYQPTKPAAAPAPQPKTTTKTSRRQASTKPTVSPVSIPNAKTRSSGLDDLVNDFKNKLKQFNTGYEANIDVYDNGSVIRSYSPLVPKQTTGVQAKPDALDQRIIADQKYLDDSIRIAEMYNQGYKTKWIISEAAKSGYEGVRNRTDITDRVALSIDSGFAYTRGKYDNIIATKLGAKEQLINDYLSGKSYKEIKENLKSKTNGMTVSDSSIRRVMHKYERASGKKVVGKRNGRGKNSQANKGSKKK